MAGVEVIQEPVDLARLAVMAEAGFGDMVKGVVDVRRGVMTIGGDLHADGEAILLDLGSAQADLWGINLYPDRYGTEDWIEFDALINIRPRLGNRSRQIQDPDVRRLAADTVARLVRPRD